MAESRVTDPDDELDRSLRPSSLDDFVAQDAVTDQLEVFIEAARRRGEPLDHVLLSGPPGLGKTSLAHIIAAELGAPLVHTAAPALERKADIAAFLTSLEPNSVFFIDEIHRLNPAIEETLYPAMEDRQPARRPRTGRWRPDRDARPAAVHPGRRDDPRRPAVEAAPRPLRRIAPPRALRRGRPRRDRAPVRRHPGGGDRAGRGGRDRLALARDAARREPAASPGPRLRRGPRHRRGDRTRSRPRRSASWTSTRRASTVMTA